MQYCLYYSHVCGAGKRLAFCVEGHDAECGRHAPWESVGKEMAGVMVRRIRKT